MLTIKKNKVNQSISEKFKNIESKSIELLDKIRENAPSS